MDCVVISPRNGTVKISRFTAVPVPMNQVHAPGAAFGDLNSRRTAPLRLSAALQARLERSPAAGPGPLHALKRN